MESPPEGCREGPKACLPEQEEEGAGPNQTHEEETGA